MHSHIPRMLLRSDVAHNEKALCRMNKNKREDARKVDPYLVTSDTTNILVGSGKMCLCQQTMRMEDNEAGEGVLGILLLPFCLSPGATSR